MENKDKSASYAVLADFKRSIEEHGINKHDALMLVAADYMFDEQLRLICFVNDMSESDGIYTQKIRLEGEDRMSKAKIQFTVREADA